MTTPAANQSSAPKRRLVTVFIRPFQEFARVGALGGMLLLLAAAVALVWANSPFASLYHDLLSATFILGPAAAPLSKTVHHWINDGLMVVFFLLVGLEIKRELLVGELASVRHATLPIAAAAGGMVVPALIYAAINGPGPGLAGWGIPMATDIAFALGILMLLGPRVPLGLKVFLTALAIVDDMGAVIVIALFYTSTLSWVALGLAALALAVLMALNARNVQALFPYMVVGVLLWLALLFSGVHSTIAGVLLALTIPARTRINADEFSERARALLDEFDRTETGDRLVITNRGQQEAIHQLELNARVVQGPLLRLERALHHPVNFGIMPIFALANAGVHLGGSDGIAGGMAVTAGAFFGLLIGKPIGILLFSWLAIRLGFAALPSGATWSGLHAIAWLGGIGFTMSLFVSALAFGDGPLNDAAKIGVLSASVMASIVGSALVFFTMRTPATVSDVGPGLADDMAASPDGTPADAR